MKSPSGVLQGRVALVTGGGRGIGKGIAIKLGEAGADVIIGDIDRDSAEQTAKELSADCERAIAIQVDVTMKESIDAAVRRVLGEFNTLDILINNAGIMFRTRILDISTEEWEKTLLVNLTGPFLFSQTVIPLMKKSGYGRIVNISSVVGLMGNVGQTNYSASKAGVIGFTKSLAREVASRGITVNAVAPGFVDTPMTEDLPEAVQKSFLDLIPMKRFCEPEEVANTVRFLLSVEAAYITGQVIYINGGLFM